MFESSIEESKSQTSFERLSQKTAYLALAFAIPVFVVFYIFGEAGRGRAAALCVGAMVVVAWMFWESRSHVWFWLVLILVSAIHVLLVAFVPWSDKSYPGLTLLPATLLDIVIWYIPMWLFRRRRRE